MLEAETASCAETYHPNANTTAAIAAETKILLRTSNTGFVTTDAMLLQGCNFSNKTVMVNIMSLCFEHQK